MDLLTIALVVALILLIFGGFRAPGAFRVVVWFLVFSLAVYLVVQLV